MRITLRLLLPMSFRGESAFCGRNVCIRKTCKQLGEVCRGACEADCGDSEEAAAGLAEMTGGVISAEGATCAGTLAQLG